MSDDLRLLWQGQEKSFTAHPVENWVFLLFHNHRFQLRLALGGADLIHVPTWGFQNRNRNRFILNVKTLEGLKQVWVYSGSTSVYTHTQAVLTANVRGKASTYLFLMKPHYVLMSDFLLPNRKK